MTKKSKVGKQRKDRYYSFAKEIGYRSRASFKLIQLNRKHEFLNKAKVCLDLCAAPGGWMQVARQNMPISSIVIGVDLFPIKPIPNCVSLVEDITTDKCRVAIQRELKTWKVDVVLHDGAPNVGQNWVQDAYKQLLLTLSAIRLSTLFLKKNGWFVTKVFRSNDYMKLFDVLKKLFKSVNVTKPDASRKESAEIYMVCKGFLAPAKIDPKLLDPNCVFVEKQADTLSKVNYRHILHPEKVKKVKALGYPDNAGSLYKKISAEQFIEVSFPVPLLAGLNEIVLDNEAINNHKATTNDIKSYCKDIKVLGTSEIRALLKWHKKVHTDLYATSEKDDEGEAIGKENESGTDKIAQSQSEYETPEDEQLAQRVKELKEVEEQVAVFSLEKKKEEKRKRKRALKERIKLNKKLNLSMVHKNDEGPELGGEELFSLRNINRAAMEMLTDTEKANQITDEILAAREEEEELAEETTKPKFKRFKSDDCELDEETGRHYLNADDSDSDVDASEKDEEKGQEEDEEEEEKFEENEEETYHSIGNQSVTDLVSTDVNDAQLRKADEFFSRDTFKGLIYAEGLMWDMDGGKVFPAAQKQTDNLDENDEEDTAVGNEYLEHNDRDMSEKGRGLKRRLTPRQLAFGALIQTNKKFRRDVMDAAWNRRRFEDTGAPKWFLENDRKHNFLRVDLPEDLVKEYAEGNKIFEEARKVFQPKKVIEAKARKKKRSQLRLEKAKSKIAKLLDDPDVSINDKTKKITKLYKRAKTAPKKEVQYVVSKKGTTASKRLPKNSGSKTRYKRVDPRMKKDTLKKKRAEKSKKKPQKRNSRKQTNRKQEPENSKTKPQKQNSRSRKNRK